MFDVILVDVGNMKINLIKVIFDNTGVSLKQAKELTDNMPSVIKKNISQAEAEKLKNALEQAGATVLLKAV